MTVAEALTELRQALKDTGPDSDRYRRSDAVFVALLNISTRRWVRKVKVLTSESTLTLTTDSNEAALPTNFLCFKDEDMIGAEGVVILNNVPLDYRPVGWMDKHASGWRGASSGVPERWHLKDLSTIRFNVPLSATASAYTGLMRHIRQPTALSASSTGTELLEGIPALYDYHDDIVLWVKARCKRQDGLKEEANDLFALWAANMDLAMTELGEMLNMDGHFRADPRWTSQWRRPPG